MSSRNAVALFDPELARKQTYAELRSKAAPKKLDVNKITPKLPEISAETQEKMNAAWEKELANIRLREEERRKRDPTYRPDALGLDFSKAKRFNKYVDYYAVLGLDRDTDQACRTAFGRGSVCAMSLSRHSRGVRLQFCSLADLKAAYKKKSLEFHPDKQLRKTPDEKARRRTPTGQP